MQKVTVDGKEYTLDEFKAFIKELDSDEVFPEDFFGAAEVYEIMGQLIEIANYYKGQI